MELIRARNILYPKDALIILMRARRIDFHPIPYGKVVSGEERGGAFVTDDRSFANIIMGNYQRPQPGNKGHFHEEGGEFWLICLGTIRYNIEGLPEFEAQEGDVVYVPRQTWHLASNGGKEGLRAACAQHIVDTIRAVAGPAVGLGDTEVLDPGAAEQRLTQGVQRMVGFMIARPESGEFVQFVLRELSIAGPGVDILYNGVFEPVHKRLCQPWGQATGQPAESERTRIAVFAMIGQVVYFRIGREAVLRRMEWGSIGPAEAAKLVTQLVLEPHRTVGH